MAIKVFVSSTFKDLEKHRKHVIQRLRKANYDVVCMEDWTSDSSMPKDYSVKKVRECQVCVLLVAFRRGFVPKKSRRSITQMEYDEAIGSQIDVLPFLLDEKKAPRWKPEFDDRVPSKRLSARENDARKTAIEAWRKHLQLNHCIESFHASQTSLDVVSAVRKWEKDRCVDYLDALRSAHGTIRFLGLGQASLGDQKDVRIDRLFVEPRLSEKPLSPDADPGGWGDRPGLLETLAGTRRVVLLGDPGAGKSTLVDWLVWNLADPNSNRVTAALGKLVPIPFVLRDLHVERGITWPGLLDRFRATPAGKHLSPERIEALLVDGNAFLILDGLDEVGNVAVRRDLRDAVWSAMRAVKYQKCHWLLTSRPVGYDTVRFEKEQLNDPGASIALYRLDADLRHVSPFDDRQIEQFARNWYAERESDPHKAKEGPANLTRAVHRHPYTLRLARIPNLLTMMTLVHRSRATLPDGKALLYEDIAKAYLETLDEYRKINEYAHSLAEMKRWLARVGFELQIQRGATERTETPDGYGILASGRELRSWLRAAMTESGKAADDQSLHRLVDVVKRRSGLLIERDDDVFAFTHLSFQEYFAAVHLREKIPTPNWVMRKNAAHGTARDDLRAYANSNVWREVMVFLFELIAEQAPDWKEPVRDAVFGSGWAEVDVRDRNRRPAACLLARLTVNPHAQWDEATVDSALTRCCEFVAADQSQSGVTADISARKEVLRILLPNGVTVDPQRLQRLATCCGATGQGGVLNLSETGVTDVSPLAGLTGLRWLDLSETDVMDVSPLAGLTGLQTLNLSGTGVMDVAPLAGLTGLAVLDLDHTWMTDVAPLAGLTGLQTLWLRLTGATAEKVARLQSHLPRLTIYH